MAPAIDDSDKRDRKLDVRASETEKDLIRQLADEDGLSLSAWVMDLILPELEKRKGYVDGARRSAPRRPNRQRQAAGQQRGSVTASSERPAKEMVRYRVYLQGTSALHIDVEAEDAAGAYEKAANLELGEWDWPEGDITEFVERIDTEEGR